MEHCMVMDVVHLSRTPGVSDLPISMRGKFAMALQLELQGDVPRASELLDKVLAAGDSTLPREREVVEVIR